MLSFSRSSILSRPTSSELCVILLRAGASPSVLENYQGTLIAARASGGLVDETEGVVPGREGVYVEECSIEKAATLPYTILSAARQDRVPFPWKSDPADNFRFSPTDSWFRFGWEVFVLSKGLCCVSGLKVYNILCFSNREEDRDRLPIEINDLRCQAPLR